MRRLIAIAGVLVLAIVSGVTGSAIAHKRAPLCDSIAGRTVSETAAVRLFRARHSGLRICARGVRGAESAFAPSGCMFVDNCAFSQLTLGRGRYYAYALRVDGGRGNNQERLSVVRGHARLAGGPALDAGGPNFAPVHAPVDVVAIVVSSAGGFAWIVRDGTVTPTDYEVHKFDAGRDAMLDKAPGIDPGSLALAGSTVYWTRDGTPQRYVLR